jgi:hypothetical protein
MMHEYAFHGGPIRGAVLKGDFPSSPSVIHIGFRGDPNKERAEQYTKEWGLEGLDVIHMEGGGMLVAEYEFKPYLFEEEPDARYEFTGWAANRPETDG